MGIVAVTYLGYIAIIVALIWRNRRALNGLVKTMLSM